MRKSQNICNYSVTLGTPKCYFSNAGEMLLKTYNPGKAQLKFKAKKLRAAIFLGGCRRSIYVTVQVWTNVLI